jgi:hypothetical protein
MGCIRGVVLFFMLLLLNSQAGEAGILYELDFSAASGPVKPWLESRGWKPLGKIMKMNPRFENGNLVLESTKSHSGAFMLEFPETGYLTNANHISIEWGVDQYPEGADWSGSDDEKRNTRNAINLMVFFGTEKVDSGHVIIPDVPYFLGIFPAKEAEEGKAYFGNYWQKGGRYYCVSGDGTKEPISTEFALASSFEDAFGNPAPPITGLAIEVDAKHTNLRNGRHTKAYIKRISLAETL